MECDVKGWLAPCKYAAAIITLLAISVATAAGGTISSPRFMAAYLGQSRDMCR